MQIAICSTFVHAQTVLRTWVDNHRAMGVTRFYLFVDDPSELAEYQAMALPDVVFIPRDAQLESHWQTLASWEFQKQYCYQQVYARQCLNTDWAMILARQEEIDWLVHIDMDEQLYIEKTWHNLAEYFSSKANADMVTFINHEAIPEQWHIVDYFSEVTLFKRNAMLFNPTQGQIAQGLFGNTYFKAYGNGKGAVNLRRGAKESSGVHLFRPCESNDIESDICVLHYTCCGFNWFYDKYKTLGWFNDFWIGQGEIPKLFPFMDQSRTAIIKGSIHDATNLYQKTMMQQGGLPASKESLLAAGVLLRTRQEFFSVL